MIKKLLPNSQFARNVITLMTGTSLAQAIPIAITPILTRIYTPEEFGLFALYMAISSILAVVVTGRYELAIVVPEHDGDAINVVALSAGLSAVISTILFGIVFVANSEIASLLGNKSIAQWLYFIPFTVMIMGIYQSLNYWSNRRKHYKRMAVSRVVQASGVSSVQLITGVYKFGGVGLILGQFIGQFIATLFLSRAILKDEKYQLKNINKKDLVKVAKRYKKFPKFLILAHGFNTGSSQAPVILLTSFFSSAVSGFYMLTERVLSAPIGLVAGAIGDVFRQEASYEYVRAGQCREVFIRTFKKLLLLSLLPFIMLFLFAEDLFGFFFGAEWITAGQYAKILIPMFFFRFITSPLSSMYMIAEAQQIDLIWQIALLSLTVFSLYMGWVYGDVKISLMFFSLSYCFMFFINLIFSYKLSSGWLRK